MSDSNIIILEAVGGFRHTYKSQYIGERQVMTFLHPFHIIEEITFKLHKRMNKNTYLFKEESRTNK